MPDDPADNPADDLYEDSARRPPSDFGTPGLMSGFRGPFADGPPPEALEVVTPPLEQVGFAELRRLVVIYVVLSLCVARSLAEWVLRRRGRSVVRAACDGAIDGFIHLGPTFVKLGQIIA